MPADPRNRPEHAVTPDFLRAHFVEAHMSMRVRFGFGAWVSSPVWALARTPTSQSQLNLSQPVPQVVEYYHGSTPSTYSRLAKKAGIPMPVSFPAGA